MCFSLSNPLPDLATADRSGHIPRIVYRLQEQMSGMASHGFQGISWRNFLRCIWCPCIQVRFMLGYALLGDERYSWIIFHDAINHIDSKAACCGRGVSRESREMPNNGAPKPVKLYRDQILCDQGCRDLFSVVMSAMPCYSIFVWNVQFWLINLHSNDFTGGRHDGSGVFCFKMGFPSKSGSSCQIISATLTR